jgi:hypothetical protein
MVFHLHQYLSLERTVDSSAVVVGLSLVVGCFAVVVVVHNSAVVANMVVAVLGVDCTPVVVVGVAVPCHNYSVVPVGFVPKLDSLLWYPTLSNSPQLRYVYSV